MALKRALNGPARAVASVVPKRSNLAGVAQLVERNLAKVDVAGSNPVSRLSEATTYGMQ